MNRPEMAMPSGFLDDVLHQRVQQDDCQDRKPRDSALLPVPVRGDCHRDRTGDHHG